MRFYFNALLLLTAGAAIGDIPDHILQWDYLTTIETPGDDILRDCVMSSDSASFKLVHLSVAEYGKKLWLLELDRAGEVINKTELLFDHPGQISWVLPRFIDDKTLAIAHCPLADNSHPELHIIDLSNPREWRTTSLSGLAPDARELWISSIEPSGTNRLLLLGTSWSPDEKISLFAAAIDLTGTILWQTSIFESSDVAINNTTMEPLGDGGCILTYSEDCFPSGIPLHRLDGDGRQIWSSFIELDCEFTAGFYDFTESDNGSILCAGGFDYMGQMAFRGITIYLDSCGEELWRRIDWYLDHTSLRSVEQIPGGSLLLSGWTGMEGSYPFGVMDMDVLIAEVDAEGKTITGFQFEEPGDQKPNSILYMGDGEYFIAGENTPEGSEDSDIFLGRILLSL